MTIDHLGRCSVNSSGVIASSPPSAPTGRPEDLGATLELRRRSLLANELGLFAIRLGRLAEAWAIRRLDDHWTQSLAEPEQTSIGLAQL